MLTVIWVKAPKNPRALGGATSLIYSGTMTVEAPAPMPFSIRPTAMVGTEVASVSNTDPTRYTAAVASIAVQRPRWLQNGPAPKAPRRPPRVKMDDTVAKAASLMGMQSAAALTRPEASSVWQVMTRLGALSSPCQC